VHPRPAASPRSACTPRSTSTAPARAARSLLIDADRLQKIWILRKLLHPMDELSAMEFIQDKMKNTKTNDEFFSFMKRG
jgi:transcription termination factor Rho